jgi:hypothetical protein
LYGGQACYRYGLPAPLEARLAEIQGWGIRENSPLWGKYPKQQPSEERQLLVAIKALVAKMERKPCTS